MRLIVFLVSILLIYFIVTQLFYHKNVSSSLKKKDKPIDKISFQPPKPRPIQVNNPKIAKLKVENPTDYFLNKVKSEYLDRKYNFNMIDLPVTSRSPNSNSSRKDNKYLQHIENNINNWKEIFDQYDQYNIKGIKPVFVKETEDEFVVQIYSCLVYRGQAIYLDLTFYGNIHKSDDFINGGTDIYIIQLVEAKKLSRSIYYGKISNYQPFVPMKKIMKYVDNVNKMHAEEANNPN